MIDLVLLGGGGHCLSILDILYNTNDYNNIVITDPYLKKGETILKSIVYGSDDSLKEIYDNGCKKAFISVGSIKDTSIRRKINDMIEKVGFELINVVSNSASISVNTKIKKGVFIGKNVVINTGTVIGENSIINTSSVVEHECYIGEYTHISCGSILCGRVHVGSDTLVGAGATIIEGLKIGNNVIIGAGSTVLRDVKDNEIVYGIVK